MTGFGILVFFTNLSLMEFQDKYLALFLLFSGIDGFEWLWVGSLHKNIQLMLEFLKVPFLVLHFSYYTLMTFLMMLSVIVLSMPMILCSTLNVIGHLICCNKTRIGFWTRIWSARHCWQWLIDFNAGKTQLVSFDRSSNTGAIDVKMDVPYSWGKIIF